MRVFHYTITFNQLKQRKAIATARFCSRCNDIILASPKTQSLFCYPRNASATLTWHDMNLIAVGFIISFVVAYAGIKIFLKVLDRVKLIPFAIYRIVLSVAILLT